MMLTYTSRRMIAVEGNQNSINQPLSTDEIAKMISGCACEMIPLKHGMVMMVDFCAGEKKSPINYLATAILYGSQPYGIEQEIRGDVVIAPGRDFEAVHG